MLQSAFLLIIILILAIILLLKISIIIVIEHDGSKSTQSVELYMFKGLVRLKKQALEKDLLDLILNTIFHIRHRNENLDNGIRYAEYFEKKITIEKIDIDIRFGTGDAYYTAMLNGVLWAASGIILSYINGRFRINKKRISITPYFDKEKFYGRLLCIIKIKVVHIIMAGIKVFYKKLIQRIKYKKRMIGGDPIA